MCKKILIVDDHLVVRNGVAMVLEKQIEDVQISNAENFFEAIDLLKDTLFDLVILDINIPGGKYTEMIGELRAIQPLVRILVFSAHEEEQHALKFISAGANGYLNKLCSEEKMIFAIKSIFESSTYISQELVSKLLDIKGTQKVINPKEVLSKRELQIAELLIEGNGNLEISNKLNIHMSTVSTYKARVFEKLKIHNLVELIKLYKSFDY
ncbi:LuxR family two component transcriptional regulator [Flavobacterium cutihirudinis]|uniref:LuxR family two component transcriptional regulator n=1 Tax=Flavobacterium cutihirudinis TaxID=1265740 RepID=A0A3D9FQF6_9FLAO|nr:response regulator transcription factor [Flavobacterium cutihirudinis]RED22631.1 LuxR family two component transcriptional regulator [Flavobacterium cutihirudinis]